MKKYSIENYVHKSVNKMLGDCERLNRELESLKMMITWIIEENKKEKGGG